MELPLPKAPLKKAFIPASRRHLTKVNVRERKSYWKKLAKKLIPGGRKRSSTVPNARSPVL
jgi:hypothetical protein